MVLDMITSQHVIVTLATHCSGPCYDLGMKLLCMLTTLYQVAWLGKWIWPSSINLYMWASPCFSWSPQDDSSPFFTLVYFLRTNLSPSPIYSTWQHHFPKWIFFHCMPLLLSALASLPFCLPHEFKFLNGKLLCSIWIRLLKRDNVLQPYDFT